MEHVLPGKGFETLRFGLNKEQVERIIGKPDEIEMIKLDDNDDKESIEAWHYDQSNFSISFDEHDDWRMGNISANNPNLVIEGVKFMNLSVLEAVNQIDKLDLGDFEVQDMEDGQKVIALYDNFINMWVDNDQIVEIQWSPFLDDEDEPIWP